MSRFLLYNILIFLSPVVVVYGQNIDSLTSEGVYDFFEEMYNNDSRVVDLNSILPLDSATYSMFVTENEDTKSDVLLIDGRYEVVEIRDIEINKPFYIRFESGFINLQFLTINNCKFNKGFKIYSRDGSINEIKIDSTYFSQLHFFYNTISKLFLYHVKCPKIEVKRTNLMHGDFEIYNDEIGTINIDRSNIKNLIMKNVGKNYFNLTLSNYAQSEIENLVKSLHFSYSNIRLAFNTENLYEYNLNIYEKFLQKYKEAGAIVSIENLDIEYKSFVDKNNGYIGYFKYIVSSMWWNYGYSKEYIFLWTFSFFILFSIINHTIGFNYFNNNIYRHSNFSRNIAFSKLGKIWYSALYTSIVFFGLKFDVEKVHHDANRNWKNRLSLFWLFFNYIIGLFCLAYLVNFVIQK